MYNNKSYNCYKKLIKCNFFGKISIKIRYILFALPKIRSLDIQETIKIHMKFLEKNITGTCNCTLYKRGVDSVKY